MTKYTDEDLVSFLDGACSEKMAQEIGTALETDAGLQARIDELDLDVNALKEHMDAMLVAAPAPANTEGKPANMSQMSAANDNKRSVRPLMRFAALLLAGVIGYGASFFAPEEPPKKPGWIAMVVNYQQLYTKNTLAHLSPTAEDTKNGLAHVSGKLGKNIEFAAATGRADLQLKQTQILAFNGKPLAQLAYQSANGVPLSLCVIKTNKQGDAAPTYKVAANMQMAVWRKGGYAYLLIGGEDKELIKSAAEDFSKSL